MIICALKKICLEYTWVYYFIYFFKLDAVNVSHAWLIKHLNWLNIWTWKSSKFKFGLETFTVKIRDLIWKYFSSKILIHSGKNKEIDGKSLPLKMFL